MMLSLHEFIVAAKALGEDLKAVSGVLTLLKGMLKAADFLAETLSKEKASRSDLWITKRWINSHQMS